MNKKYIVRLSDEERASCQEVIKKLKGSSQKFRRAQILLKADADGPAWPDVKIAEAFDCRVQTIENLRKRLVTEGFELALEGKKRQEVEEQERRLAIASQELRSLETLIRQPSVEGLAALDARRVELDEREAEVNRLEAELHETLLVPRPD